MNGLMVDRPGGREKVRPDLAGFDQPTAAAIGHCSTGTRARYPARPLLRECLRLGQNYRAPEKRSAVRCLSPSAGRANRSVKDRLGTLVLSGTLLLLSGTVGCAAGGIWEPEGPHPHVSVAGALHVRLPANLDAELLHSPVSNAKPVTDLTAITITRGISVGDISLGAGAGWQVSRMWDGPCDSEGFNCQMSYADGWVAVVGVTYTTGHFRADLRGFSFDNSPVGARTNLPLELEAVVLLFGFSP